MKKNVISVVAFLGCSLNSFLAGVHTGYDEGVESARALTTQGLELFTISDGGRSYLANWHLYIAFCFAFLVFIAARDADGQVLKFAKFLAIAAALFIYIRWIGSLFSNSELSFWTNLENTFHSIDYISIFLVVTLLGVMTHDLISKPGK